MKASSKQIKFGGRNSSGEEAISGRNTENSENCFWQFFMLLLKWTIGTSGLHEPDADGRDK